MFKENQVSTPDDEFSQRATEAIFEEYRTSTRHDCERSPCNLEAPEHVQQGAEALRFFPSRELSQTLLDRYFEVCELLVHQQVIYHCHETFWSTFGHGLGPQKSREQAAAISKSLCSNAMSQLPVAADARQWLASFSNEKMRWEIVGNLFAIFGLASMTLSDWNPLFSEASSYCTKKQFGGKMRECAEACLALCNDVDTVNEFVISLMASAYSLQAYYEGDNSQQLWRRHGGMASAVTALGLHREPESAYSPSTNHCFLVAEHRRRLFCYFFSLDKQLSTFMGRPPALSRRYSTCKMPLDLTDEQMMAEGQELDKIKTRLDANGWNTDGIVSPNRIFRAWMCLSVIRDEILELALGPPCPDLHTRREELIRKSESMYEQMPKSLHFEPGDPDRQRLTPFLYTVQINYYQERLLNRFLLDRLPETSSRQVKQDLIETARKILDGVLEQCANRDRLVDYNSNFVWAITYSGIPSAGVLSVELLRQCKYPGTVYYPLPRSEIIQNLSVFIGCLDWVRPSEGNYTLCARMRKVIKRILDEVLELPPPSNVEPLSGVAPEGIYDEQPVSSMFELENDAEFLDWLNSGDWTRDMLQDPWM